MVLTTVTFNEPVTGDGAPTGGSMTAMYTKDGTTSDIPKPGVIPSTVEASTDGTNRRRRTTTRPRMSDSTRPMTRAVKRRLEEAARTTNDETYESAPQQERVTVGTTPRETGDTPITSATVIRGAGPEELTTRSSHRRSNDSAKGITTGKKKQHRVTWAMDDAQRGFAACSSTRGHKWCKAGDGRRSNQSKRPVRGAKDSDYDGVRSITKDGTITKHKAKVTMPEADQQTREDVRVRKSKQQRRPETIRESVQRVDETVVLQLTDTVISEAQAINQLVQKMLEESVHKGMAVNTEYGSVLIETPTGRRVVLPPDLWPLVFKDSHDSVWTGHLRAPHTYARIAQLYYWPDRKREVRR
ncbi:hypothetical protein PC116_g19018 [Phytophthora cactorum]|nr:hypothetical protein PC114_g460 [Phytophthora cactorum]KAG4232765.1 hypothetical protein PC116_g19018 [Phytophthora cactorum]